MAEFKATKCPGCGRYIDKKKNYIYGMGKDTCEEKKEVIKAKKSSKAIAEALPDVLDGLLTVAVVDVIIDSVIDIVDGV